MQIREDDECLVCATPYGKFYKLVIGSFRVCRLVYANRLKLITEPTLYE